jgi:tetratricopeptide (TPR) repeat protein
MTGLFLNCATSRYRIADKVLGQGQNEQALREYLKVLHQDKRMNGTYTDVRALLGATAAYYQLGQYAKAQRMCKIILKIDPQSGGAYFYAGSSLDEQGKKDWALKFYKQFVMISDRDPYKPFLEARYHLTMEEEVARQLRAAIRRERNLETSDIQPNTLAVLYFVSSDESAEADALSKGIAEMIITDLSQVKQLNIVERLQLEKLLSEMQLGRSGLTDPNTIPRYGKLLKANTLVSGAFSISGADLHLTTSLADITASRSFEADRFSGMLENIFTLEKDIVMGILEQLGIVLSSSEQALVMQMHTKNFDAFLAYCYGLDLMDQGRYSGAVTRFQEAITLDPNFRLAQNKFDLMSAIDLVLSRSSIYNHIQAKQRFATNNQGATLTALLPLKTDSRARLDRMSYQLDLGFLPTQESRRDAAELQSFGITLERVQLPEPPPPPGSN